MADCYKKIKIIVKKIMHDVKQTNAQSQIKEYSQACLMYLISQYLTRSSSLFGLMNHFHSISKEWPPQFVTQHGE